MEQINKMVFHAMSQALTETKALLRKRAKSNVGVASVEGESGDIETDELSFPKRQDVSSQGNLRPNTNQFQSRPPQHSQLHQNQKTDDLSRQLIESQKTTTQTIIVRQKQNDNFVGNHSASHPQSPDPPLQNSPTTTGYKEVRDLFPEMQTEWPSVPSCQAATISLTDVVDQLRSYHQAESSKLVNRLEELTKQQQKIQQRQDLISEELNELSSSLKTLNSAHQSSLSSIKTTQTGLQKVDQSMKDVKSGVTSVATKLSDTQTQFVAVPNSTTEEVSTSKDQSGPVQELMDVESDDTLDQFMMLKERSAAETESAQEGNLPITQVQPEADGCGSGCDNRSKFIEARARQRRISIEQLCGIEEESKQPKETKEDNVDTEADQQPKETEVENVQAESAQGQAVLQAVGLRQHEVVVQSGKEKTLLEAEEEWLKVKYAEERSKEDTKGAIAAKRLHEEELKKRKEELDRIDQIAKADEEMIKKMKSKKKGRKGPSKPSNKKTASSMRVIQAEKQKLEEFVKRRAFPEKILRVQLKKRSKSKYPNLHLIRQGGSTSSGIGEMLEMADLFKLGYSECVEIYNILTQFKPNNYRIVTEDLLKRFGKMKELGIGTTGLPQPITPQDEVDEEEDVEVGPVLKKKKKFTMLDVDRIVDAAHILTKMKKVGYYVGQSTNWNVC